MATFPGLPRPVFAYNFGAVQCILGTVPLSNFGSDGGIEGELPSQLLESEVSADGYVIYTANNDERIRFTITLSAHSGALPLLEAMVFAQSAVMHAGGTLPVLPFFLLDPATGDEITSEHTIFLQSAVISKGKSAGTRQYIIELPYARHRQVVGAKNAPTL